MTEYLECNGKNNIGCGCKEFKIYKEEKSLIAECIKCLDKDVISTKGETEVNKNG